MQYVKWQLRVGLELELLLPRCLNFKVITQCANTKMVYRHLRYPRLKLSCTKLHLHNVRGLVTRSESITETPPQLVIDRQEVPTDVKKPLSNYGKRGSIPNIPSTSSSEPSVILPLLLAEATNQGGESKPDPEDDEEISDQEWEIRTGMYRV